MRTKGFNSFGCANYNGSSCEDCGSLKIEKEIEKLSKKSRSSVVFDENHLFICSALLSSKVDVLERDVHAPVYLWQPVFNVSVPMYQHQFLYLMYQFLYQQQLVSICAAPVLFKCSFPSLQPKSQFVAARVLYQNSVCIRPNL